jgi:hypothetical protein
MGENKMIIYDERVGTVAVYEAKEKINCLYGLETKSEKLWFKKNGVKNGKHWEIPKRFILQAKIIYIILKFIKVKEKTK